MTGSRRPDSAGSFHVFQDNSQHSSDDFRLLQSLQEYTSENMPHPLSQTVDTNLILNPPQSQSSFSPTKRPSPSSSPLLNVDASFFNSVDMPAPPQSFVSDSPQKKLASFAPYYSCQAPKPKKALFSMFPSSAKTTTKDATPGDAVAHSTGPTALLTSKPASAAGHKRHLTEPTLTRDKNVNKKRVVEDTFDTSIPEPEDMPPVVDEGGKPPFSYAQLIGMAIMRAPARKMTLAQIYKWINETFEHYRSAGTGWQNSIRHNLSLNKAFLKSERPKEDPGKGNYWTIGEEHQLQFVRDRPQRRPVTADQQSYAASFDAPSSELARPTSSASFTVPSKPSRIAADSSKFPVDDPSSDATVADPEHEEHHMPPPRQMQVPPEEDDIQSSPPVPRAAPNGTPSFNPGRSGDRKRKQESFRDSGFYSSIDSSAARPTATAPLYLTSDAARSSVHKRGRAEDEIARMRSSSFDHSPSKPSAKRPRLSAQAAPSSALMSSSPLRQNDSGEALTPGPAFKRPADKQLAAVSPRTLLENHRKGVRALVGTPATTAQLLKASANVSPLSFSNFLSPDKQTWVKWDAEAAAAPLIDEPFEQSPPKFGPVPSLDPPFPEDDPSGWNDYNRYFHTGSPAPRKTTAQRPNLARANTASGILGDITNGSRGNMRLASPFRMSSANGSNRAASPIKRSTDQQQSSLKADAFVGYDESDSDSGDPFASLDLGIDLSRPNEFRAIGSKNHADKENNFMSHPQPSKKAADVPKGSSRPAFGRTLTNTF